MLKVSMKTTVCTLRYAGENMTYPDLIFQILTAFRFKDKVWDHI